MKKIALQPDKMAETIKKIIEKSDDYFVFPTDVVMNSWIDWIIINTDNKAVALERFTAWDNFKSDFVSAHQEGKSVIPSVLRKMFVNDLIARNSSLPKEQRFHVIINSDDKFAKEASSFADWICDILRSLHFWKCRLVENVPEDKWDDEDREYYRLYNDYNDFLEKNNLFEPSWIDNIEFSGNEKTFHIFYPELLEDFIDYKDVLSKADNIYFYTMPTESDIVDVNDVAKSHEVYIYPDSRKELRQTMLYMANLVNNGKAEWFDFALSVPNIETYRPYLQREFDLYGIPYVIKAGVSLTKNSAGRIFREIKDCHDTDFSYDSVRTLLLDECVPWKEGVAKIKERLIREGNRMRCICSVNNDIWINAFNRKIENLNKDIQDFSNKANNKPYNKDFTCKKERAENELKEFSVLKDFYFEFKKHINAFFPENNDFNNFENIRNSWMSFKNVFLKENEDFSEDANNILSRCIVELNEIISIEDKYKECNLIIPSPFEFFLQTIDKKSYTKQTKKTGVNIFPYKLSAAANFKYQFVIDCSQKNIDISYGRLLYLSNDKREKLKLTDDDKFITLYSNGKNDRLKNPSEVFIELYGKNCNEAENIIHFSAATDTFNGFAIPHNYLKISEKSLPDFDNEDYILQERKFILSQARNSNSSNFDDDYDVKNVSEAENFKNVKLLESQVNSYKNWTATSINQNNEEYKINETIRDSINKKLITNHKKEADDNNIKITARGSLENFFPCPRKWIFKSILKLSDDSLDTNLMKIYDMGNLNHKILEKFMEIHKDIPLPYFDKNEEIFKIREKKNGIINVVPSDYSLKMKDIFYNIDGNKSNSKDSNIVEKAILEPSEFRDSPLVIETLLSQKKKIADRIIGFLKVLLLPYGGLENEKISNFNGIGNCTVAGIEDTLVAKEDNYDYLGKIDCYLLSPENEWIIIDYKNSKTSIPKENEFLSNQYDILGDFQMTVYHKLLSQKEQKHELCASYFYSVKDKSGTKFTDNLAKKTNFEEERESERVLGDYANLFIEKIDKAEFEPYTSYNKYDKLSVFSYKNCKNCAYKTICRTTYNIAGKELPKK